MVTDTMLWSIEIKWKITHGLSIGNMTFDLGWPWTVLDLGHKIFSSNISNMKTDTMLDSIDVR